MKKLIKRILAALGLRLHRINPGLIDGQDLERDLPLVVGSGVGRVCFDVGAHDGLFTTLLQNVLDQPLVHAFEPAPEPFARLQSAHGREPGVYLANVGVGDEAGQLTFNVYQNQALNSFLPLDSSGKSQFRENEEGKQLSVDVILLDDYAEQKGIKVIDLLKMDTQGYEMHVLRGAERLLASGAVRAVLVEMSFTPLYDHQVWGHEVMSLLHEHGFRLVDFYEKCRLNPYLGWCTALFSLPAPVPSK